MHVAGVVPDLRCGNRVRFSLRHDDGDALVQRSSSTAILAPTGSFTGVGFAVPVDTVTASCRG
jgi:hypothetical protein